MKIKLPVIAVLLTCHNRRNKTLRCLNNLFAQNDININFTIEVFLVDDGSSDGTSEAVADKFPEITIIKGDGNLFWNRGMHLAWVTAAKKKDYDFYLWLNDDTFILENAVNVLLDSYSKANTEAIIAGATQSEVSHKYTYGGENADCKIVIPDGTLQNCQFMNGNFVLISRSIFNKVGVLDTLFHHAMGDRDYGLRAIKKGFKIFIAPIYIGICEEHDKLAAWCSPDTPLKKRLKLLYSPRGVHPYLFFVYEKRHFGILTATKHYFTLHLRALMPSLWI